MNLLFVIILYLSIFQSIKKDKIYFVSNNIMESILILPRVTLICSICDDLLESPYECIICHNLFCADCIKSYLDTKDKYRRLYFCPMCRNKKNNFIQNSKINDLLEDFKNSGKKLCIKCNSVLNQEKYKSHINKCWYKCIICHQLFPYEKKFLEHYTINENKNELNKILNKFNRKANTIETNSKENNEKIKREKFENNLPKDNIKKENNFTLIDRNGYNIEYDLYFCGKDTLIDCNCCSIKKCCPKGELCQNCMKKNVKYHSLKGYYLINKKGKACKYKNGSFHCFSKFYEIKRDKGGNFYKDEKICCYNYTCEACQNITNLMNYYLSANIIKKLIERDSLIFNKVIKNNYQLNYINL